MVQKGRPRCFDRQQALEAATRLFWERGYDGASLADLTSAMGISPSSLYAAFGSKRSLFAEAVDSYIARYEAIFEEVSGNAASSFHAVERFLRRSVDEFTDPQRPMSCLMVSAAIQGGADTIDVRVEMEARLQGLFHRVGALIAADIAAGVLPGDTDASTLAQWAKTVWEGLSNQSNSGHTRAQLHAVIAIAMKAWPGGPRGS